MCSLIVRQQTRWLSKLKKSFFRTRKTSLHRLGQHYSLLAILIGSAFVALSFGPYYNWDALLEYDAASSTVREGFPRIYTNGHTGELINQPPLGFYIDAIFFKIFGSSYNTGVAVITLFGLGCVLLVYMIGKILYGKNTALVASALFGLTPWHVAMSRIFLIDAQCLFFSLLCLLTGLWAIQKQSLKIFFLSGTIFGLALLTKAFAVFSLVPLSIFYVYHRPKALKNVLEDIVIFLTPAAFLHILWYEIISGQGMFVILSHSDFYGYFPEDIAPSWVFLLQYFIKNLGLAFSATCALSLLLSLSQRKLFGHAVTSDLICLATILSVTSFNLFLVLVKKLWVPFNNPIKFDYQSLPAFCWLAASFISKYHLHQRQMDSKGHHQNLVSTVLIIGLALLTLSMAQNMFTLNIFVRENILRFRVEQDIGYPLQEVSPGTGNTRLLPVAFILIASGLCSFNLKKLQSLASRILPSRFFRTH